MKLTKLASIIILFIILGGVFCGIYINNIIKSLELDISTYKTEISTKNNEIKATQTKLNDYEAKLNDYEAKLNDYEAKLNDYESGAQSNKERFNKYSDFVYSLLSSYESALTNINKSDYLNAQKAPQKNEVVKFCIVVSSYNNIKYTTQSLNSIFKQNYHNWRMIYVDDASNDGMSELVAKIKRNSRLPDNKFTLLRHKTRIRSSVYNHYESANSFCQDDEVMVHVDGDDMLATPNALTKLAENYSDGKTWMTYGNFVNSNDGTYGDCCNQEILESSWSSPTRAPMIASHLRTVYTWLFKKIKLEDLKYKGEFIHFATDVAMMYPMLEMAGKDRVKFIKDILYIYRRHPSNESATISGSAEQAKVRQHILDLPRYKKVETNGQ